MPEDLAKEQPSSNIHFCHCIRENFTNIKAQLQILYERQICFDG